MRYSHYNTYPIPTAASRNHGAVSVQPWLVLEHWKHGLRETVNWTPKGTRIHQRWVILIHFIEWTLNWAIFRLHNRLYFISHTKSYHGFKFLTAVCSDASLGCLWFVTHLRWENFISNEIVIYTIFLRSVIFPYTASHTPRILSLGSLWSQWSKFVVDSRGATKFSPLWWRISISIRVQTTLNHFRFVLPQYSTLKKVFISEREQNHDTKKEQALPRTFS